MSVLTTDFPGSSVDTSLFDKVETFGTVTQTGGEVIFTGSGGGGICYLQDKVVRDITAGDNWTLQMSGTTPPYPCRMWLGAIDASGKGWGIRYGGTGVNIYQIGTFSTGLGSWSAGANYGDYDVAVHVFQRVRYASGTIYWEYSTDGISYTTRSSASMPSGMDLTTMKGFFGQIESDSSDVYKATAYYAPALSGATGVRRKFVVRAKPVVRRPVFGTSRFYAGHALTDAPITTLRRKRVVKKKPVKPKLKVGGVVAVIYPRSFYTSAPLTPGLDPIGGSDAIDIQRIRRHRLMPHKGGR